MFIQAFGLKFIRLQEEDIELVRYWRNSEKIRQYMHFREYITKEMQQKWFKSINNIYNYYFIIHYKQSKIGLVNVRDVNYNERTGDIGIFIWEDKYIGSKIPAHSLFMIGDFSFYFLRLKKVYGTVLKNNAKVISHNLKLGGVIIRETGNKLLLKFSKERYESKTHKLKKAAQALTKTGYGMNIIIEKCDYNNDLAQHLQGIYDGLPYKLKRKNTLRVNE